MKLADIYQHSPHRAPMIWIDEIVTSGASEGECLVRLKKSAHYMDERGLRPTSCIEFVAQAYGYMSIAFRASSPSGAKPLKKAFLASIKDARFAPQAEFALLNEGDELRVHISNVRQIGPLTMVHGTVRRGAIELCSTQLKVYSES